MKRSSSAAVSVGTVQPRPHPPPADALLRFQLRTYQPRASAHALTEADRGPGSIKEAIVRWLDEQL